ncbi:MAG TPA: peptidase S10 [Thermoanaerobaculia bacterium]|jgi:carboxypeptidase C (cathepsin A)|nr:peptidase S10 [Thermoanaerobaculia bacterium]
MSKRIAFAAFALILLALPALAQPPGPPSKEAKAEAKPNPAPPEEKTSVTHHSLTLDGRSYPYTATAGTLLLKDDDGTVKASIFYISYALDGVKDPGTRPVTFSFNGGPGSASLWVHMGAFGPKRVERTEEGFSLPPPGKLVDNEGSILDATDLVFIDPVSTGFSRAAPGQDPKQFHGVKEDIDSVAAFIRLWVARNQRWASPKFVAGESYGTTRAAGLAYQLADRYGMMLNGVILISSVLNWQDQDFHPGNDRPCFIHLPTYAATAWYHKKLPPELSGDLMKTLSEVETFALDEYGPALLQGDRLPDARRHEIAAKVARYSGLSPAYVERSNLCVEIDRFVKELLRDEGKTTGRLDTRFTGHDLDSVGEVNEYDPASAALDGPYAAAVNDYIRRDLKFESDLVYERLTDKVWPWSWDADNQFVNVAESLRQAMTRNPHLQVLMAAGVFDLATPFFDALFTRDHLGLPQELRGNVRIELYQSGHMIYIRKADHAKLKRDVTALIQRATAG